MNIFKKHRKLVEDWVNSLDGFGVYFNKYVEIDETTQLPALVITASNSNPDGNQDSLGRDTRTVDLKVRIFSREDDLEATADDLFSSFFAMYQGTGKVLGIDQPTYQVLFDERGLVYLAELGIKFKYRTS